MCGAAPSPRRRKLTKFKWSVLVSLLLSVGFCYGFISFRNEYFPYHAVLYVYRLCIAEEHQYKGEWGPVSEAHLPNGLRDSQNEQLSQLSALGYLAGYEPVPSDTGVVVHHPQLAYQGYNYYVSGHAPEAILMDMDGNVLHRWHKEFDEVWPNVDSRRAGKRDYWRHSHLFKNGDLLAIYEGLGLIKIDKNSNLLWSYSHGCHHDLDVLDDGRIYVLTREVRSYARLRGGKPLLEDFVTILSADGQSIKRVSILQAFLNSPYKSVLNRVPGWYDNLDIFHTNTVEVLDGRLHAMSPAFKRGNVLISLREVDVIAVVDMDQASVLWAMSGMWKAQHKPTVLENGNILLFDNHGHGGFSKVIEFNPFAQEPSHNLLDEFDPFQQQVAWIYGGDKTNGFFSRTCGSAERLPNGNTLIKQTNSGRVFEVTPDKKTAWEFLNPERAGAKDELIASVFDLVRVGPDFPMDWLD